MKLSTFSAILALASSLAHADPAPSPPTARELHAAQCVAALEVNTEALASQVKGGKDDVRPLLQDRLEAGTAFVGDSYLHGTTDEDRARGLANDALEAQKSLTDAQLTARQNACADEGGRLFAKSNMLEQAIVKRLARRRMERLLRD